jgi:hypothetical protein
MSVFGFRCKRICSIPKDRASALIETDSFGGIVVRIFCGAGVESGRKYRNGDGVGNDSHGRWVADYRARKLLKGENYRGNALFQRGLFCM